jgi:hypothetical protein
LAGFMESLLAATKRHDVLIRIEGGTVCALG